MLRLFEELDSHGAVSGCSSCSECGGDECGFAYFLRGGSGLLCALHVNLNAVRALRGASDSDGDEFAVFASDGSVFACDDAVEIEPSGKFRWCEFADLLEIAEVGWIVIVVAHVVHPLENVLLRFNINGI
jgi:hypothetical protein